MHKYYHNIEPFHKYCSYTQFRKMVFIILWSAGLSVDFFIHWEIHQIKKTFTLVKQKSSATLHHFDGLLPLFVSQFRITLHIDFKHWVDSSLPMIFSCLCIMIFIVISDWAGTWAGGLQHFRREWYSWLFTIRGTGPWKFDPI